MLLQPQDKPIKSFNELKPASLNGDAVINLNSRDGLLNGRIYGYKSAGTLLLNFELTFAFNYCFFFLMS